jgi:ABC-type branched-subunit amino acid transport system substrate-binding protein
MDLNSFFQRYKPYLAIVAAVVALVAFLPGSDDSEALATGGFRTADGQTVDGTGSTGPGGVPGAQGAAGAGGGAAGSGAATGGGGGGAGGGGGGGGGGEGGEAGGGGQAAPVAGNALENPACDPATGRIRVPSNFAPPCVPVFAGDNGGATHQGVTADTLKLVYFQPESDPAVDAALTAAGASNSAAEQRATFQGYVEMFNAHYETYGRTVEVVYRQGSGKAGDDAIGRADALAIATEDKPFAVIGAPNSAFVEELAAREIICICLSSLPQEQYERLDPYFGYTSLMGSTQGYMHRAEYIGKRLAGRTAVHAGTRDGLPMSTEQRKFGLLYYDTPDGSYKSGVDFFVQELRKYGVEMAEVLAYPSDFADAAERARPLIQRLKNSGVNSVMFSGDFINPAVYTRQATQQAYFPEWIISGSVLTDTSLFARTYDPSQWSRAFGISYLTTPVPDQFNNAYRLWEWHHGNGDIPAGNQFKVIFPGPFTFFTGVHLAGPNLTPRTWQQGLFSYPSTGAGSRTSASVSLGNQGVWPFTDYTLYDDVTEIWWDPSASGNDEVGNPGAGMYRYVDGGRRYLPGQHPNSDPVVFTARESAPTGYDAPPEGEVPPDYPRPQQ